MIYNLIIILTKNVLHGINIVIILLKTKLSRKQVKFMKIINKKNV